MDDTKEQFNDPIAAREPDRTTAAATRASSGSQRCQPYTPGVTLGDRVPTYTEGSSRLARHLRSRAMTPHCGAPASYIFGCQVVYVAPSPFLIDKNRSDRIWAMDKGVVDESTRVVGDIACDYYEPLRSAFDTLVAKNSFMGTRVLMDKGVSRFATLFTSFQPRSWKPHWSPSMSNTPDHRDYRLRG